MDVLLLLFFCIGRCFSWNVKKLVLVVHAQEHAHQFSHGLASYESHAIAVVTGRQKYSIQINRYCTC